MRSPSTIQLCPLAVTTLLRVLATASRNHPTPLEDEQSNAVGQIRDLTQTVSGVTNGTATTQTDTVTATTTGNKIVGSYAAPTGGTTTVGNNALATDASTGMSTTMTANATRSANTTTTGNINQHRSGVGQQIRPVGSEIRKSNRPWINR
jgi:hypothetical protein